MKSSQWGGSDISNRSESNSKPHQLIEKVQRLQEAISQRDDPTRITALIKDLKYQAVLYFFQKEKQMLNSHNKAYHHHRQAHDQFIWKVTDLQAEFTSKHHPQVMALCHELQKWMYDFGPFMEQ